MCRCCKNGSSGDEQPPASAYVTALLTITLACGTAGCVYVLYTEPESVLGYLVGTVVSLLTTILTGRTCIKIIRQYNQRGRPK